MLITLCYVYLWVRYQKCYTLVIRSTIHRLCGNRRSFTFCTLKPEKLERGKPIGKESFNKLYIPSLLEDTVFLQLGNKAVYITEPQVCEDLSKWTLLGSPLIRARRTEHVAFLIAATSEQEVGIKSHTPSKYKPLKWSDYCLPLACCLDQPFRAVAETSADDFWQLGVAFMEDRLLMDNGLVPEIIVSVELRESALKELVEGFPNGQKQVGLSSQSLLRETVSAEAPPCGTGGGAESQTDQQVAVTEGLHMAGLHLHLSSCHECLELENSTIQSVKFASAENIPDLPDDYEWKEAMGGDAHKGESSMGQTRRVNPSGKPPNVLVYTGGCLEGFQSLHTLLAQCIDADSYAIYHLEPGRALSEPWVDNALLLVLATEEPLDPQFQERVLAYLSRGGKVLGLSCTLCLGGLSLTPRNAQRNQIRELRFTRADATDLELSVLASGRAFSRLAESGAHGAGEVEEWGELCSEDRDKVIVRVPHGEAGGEAVLCQVHLETAPDSQELRCPEDFDRLKKSNALRYEVLSGILVSLGLNCELTQLPPSSPVYLLSTSQKSKDDFLKWLQKQVDSEGLLKSPKVSLKVVPCTEPPPELPEGALALVTEHPEPLSQQFSLQAYSLNLRTGSLGRVLLYAEVTPTTMDLLDGFVLQVPEDVGLIAVAARQTKGKGRGGNAWLSPLGCAMFTLHVQVPVASRLGKRIPFLQHLAALAVVEAVRTLPGYEDINLRVKWPNDIYYSNVMKLGGVLVNSTVAGPMFHLLVGCGFNVSNSNPTICINDLVVQHNKERGSALEPLSPAQLIARTVSSLEELIATFQDGGPQAVLPLYYDRWVHSDTQVRLWSEDGPRAKVVGLDDNGFLKVRSQDQVVVTVQPDGNSFDMLRNLVVTKPQ